MEVWFPKPPGYEDAENDDDSGRPYIWKPLKFSMRLSGSTVSQMKDIIDQRNLAPHISRQEMVFDFFLNFLFAFLLMLFF